MLISFLLLLVSLSPLPVVLLVNKVWLRHLVCVFPILEVTSASILLLVPDHHELLLGLVVLLVVLRVVWLRLRVELRTSLVVLLS